MEGIKDSGALSVPNRVYGMGGQRAFHYTVLRESYGDGLALSWVYEGDTEGFLIYDADGKLVEKTENIYEHYCFIKGYGTEAGFVVKAYVETLKGKLILAESEMTYLKRVEMDEPQVSLIIPAYNREKYVARSIDSVLAQSFCNVEIVVVDDGSVDHTAGIIDWYAAKYPNVVAIHQENGGAAMARNTGIKRAAGEYIGFLDSDDMIRPGMISKMYRLIKENDCDIAMSSIYLIENKNYRTLLRYPMKENIAIRIEDFFQMHFDTGCMFAVVTVNKLYRAALVKDHPFPAMLAEDDAWTPYILSYADKICYCKDCFYEYYHRIQEKSLSEQLLSKEKAEIEKTFKTAHLYYLKNGNPKRKNILLRLANSKELEEELEKEEGDSGK